jgi:ribosome-associated translation inhibitor RaiA
MRIRYHDHGQLTEAVYRAVEEEARRLDQHFADVAEDLVLLDVTVEHHLRDDTYTAKVVLRVPRHELAAAGNGPRRETAVHDAFNDLRDEVDVYLAKLRGEPAVRRESKFHRDKAALAAEAIEATQDWPSEPPHSDDEAVEWGHDVEGTDQRDA